MASLQNQHMKKSSITAKSFDNLDDQSQAVQDYVVSHIASSTSSSGGSTTSAGSSQTTAAASAKNHTIIVAPVTDTTDSQRQYGDYFGSHITEKTSASVSSSSPSTTESPSGASLDTDSSNSSASPSTTSNDASTTRHEAIVRLRSALNLARNSGMHVVLLSSTFEGFTPDLFVPMASVAQMAQVQAKQLVSKLELDKTSKENPKQIEVLLPSGSSTTDTADVDTFNKTAFSAIWEVLGPYFRSGAVESPSGLLDKNSSADSWKLLKFNASNEDSVKKELTARLGKQNKSASTRTRIDGILSMNDYVASEVTETLTSMGYTGSSADINPEISIAGIVDNITGKKDLKKSKAPDPSVAPSTNGDADSSGGSSSQDSSSSDSSSSDSSSSQQSDDTGGLNSSAWPIVTGYGAYLDNIPTIVDGQQWMTSLEDRKGIGSTLAKAVVQLNTSQQVNADDSIRTETSNGISAPTLQKELLTVSASNLKSVLIDTNYVTAADAGL
jgi:ABC-type xylose transport system substrate-binding protein